MMVNTKNEVEILWRDTFAHTNATHPLNAWITATQSGIGNVYPTTSLGYTTFFYAQMADKSISGYNIFFAAENTTILESGTFSVTNADDEVKPLGGSRFTVRVGGR